MHKAEKKLIETTTQYERTKQESNAYFKEMEMATQALDEITEQNTRLLHQLSERDDTVIRLTSSVRLLF